MRALPARSLVVLPSASINYMSGVIPYPFRQDPDFFYLTGLSQRGVAILYSPAQGECTYTLFVDDPNAERARWDGHTVDLGAAVHVFGADSAHHLSELPLLLMKAAGEAAEIFCDADRPSAYYNSTVQDVLQAAIKNGGGGGGGGGGPPAVGGGGAAAGARGGEGTAGRAEPDQGSPLRMRSLRHLMHAMRVQKSPAEARMMRASASLAARALRMCMGATRPGVREVEVAALFEYACRSRGASRMAFPLVVAGGADACTIHYGRNDKVLQAGQLLLMDAGCELHGYCSDVTRTWPVGGRYSPAQRAVYDLVLSVHASCVRACKPGVTLRDLHALSVRLISEGLVQLGACGPTATLSQVEGGLYRTFFWHSLGHWLGLDTHDSHLMGHDRPLQPGHVITIEPGVYVPDEPRYGALRGIGVRIEDDVLVTPGGCEVMSAGVPRLPEEVEALVGSMATSPAAQH